MEDSSNMQSGQAWICQTYHRFSVHLISSEFYRISQGDIMENLSYKNVFSFFKALSYSTLQLPPAPSRPPPFLGLETIML